MAFFEVLFATTLLIFLLRLLWRKLQYTCLQKTVLNDRYIDDAGYFRYASSDKLIHRHIAYKYLYKPNEDYYDLSFSEYQVHHIDGNKLHNSSTNLQIVTPEEHAEIHSK